jgi:hypothetical protein
MSSSSGARSDELAQGLPGGARDPLTEAARRPLVFHGPDLEPRGAEKDDRVLGARVAVAVADLAILELDDHHPREPHPTGHPDREPRDAP